MPDCLPSIGELEPWAHEVPSADVENGVLSGWRKELDRIGRDIAQKGEALDTCQISRPIRGDGKITWFGEVTDVSRLISFRLRPSLAISALFKWISGGDIA